MFPLFLVLFGVGDATKISVAAFGAALVILFNVAYGVMNARKTRILAAKVMGASRLAGAAGCDAAGIAAADLRRPAQRRFARARHRRRRRDVHRLDGWSRPSACSRRSSCSTCRDMYAAIFAAGALGYGLNLLFLLIEKTLRPLVREITASADRPLAAVRRRAARTRPRAQGLARSRCSTRIWPRSRASIRNSMPS